MRTFFVFCFVASVVVVTASSAQETEVVTALSARAVSGAPSATANPTTVLVPLPATPTPTPAPTPAPMPAPTGPPKPPDLVFKPSAPLAPIADETPEPTPSPTPEPTPDPATAAPSADPKTGEGDATPSPKAAPTPTPAPPAGGKTYTRDQVISQIRAAWGGNDDKAVRVADCESGLNPRATSPGGTYLGLWQFHIETWRSYGGTGDPRDRSPRNQTQVAWRLFQDHRWAPWPGCA